ncbi:MAG: hydroxymethylbilane synthase [Polyangia bacterium]
MIIRIATRGSMLALWQANHVKAELERREPGLTVELLVLKTRGDLIVDRPLSEVGGKALFVKEIEEALLDRRAHIAVHSMKDVPAELAPGLAIVAVPEREDPRDALILRPGLDATSVATLPRDARVGTSSLRRLCQLRAIRPDLVVEPLRGNVDTRLARVARGDYDAIVLACAGLHRLGYGDRIACAIDPVESLPAVGQGALALECHVDDDATRARLAVMNHVSTARAVAAERAALVRLQGSCQTPLAAFATEDGGALRLRGLVGSTDGTRILRADQRGDDPQALGDAVADALLALGAAELLARA